MSDSVQGEFGVRAFRAKLLVAMTLVVVGLMVSATYVAEQALKSETQYDLQVAFASELNLLRTVRDIRHTALEERCRALVLKPRIHAALEDNALDLLYPSAKDELGEALPADNEASVRHSIRPRFYRFLDISGRVIAPLDDSGVGELAPEEEGKLAFNGLPREQQSGYLVREGQEIIEVIVTPVVSMADGEEIAALVSGFLFTTNGHAQIGWQSGIWESGKLHMAGLSETGRAAVEGEVTRLIKNRDEAAGEGLRIEVDGEVQMLFVELLNPSSLFAPAYEVGLYPLTSLLALQSRRRWQAGFVGALLLALGVVASYYVSARLAAPVHKLAGVSEENRVLRDRAVLALEIKRGELARAERFSSDTSHQLKTPVAVLRAGLDELLAGGELSAEMRAEVELLVQQTLRLTHIIEDLLLLSQLDSGRLELKLVPVDLRRIVETCVDDLGLLYEESAPQVQCELPETLQVSGDPCYTMLIVQNLLENAHKYGSPGAPIRVTAREMDGAISLVVANRGKPIPRDSWENIFDRFHRGAVGENISGHGLGLNLARELARLHCGSLRLLRSDEDWTEFEARFLAVPPQG